MCPCARERTLATILALAALASGCGGGNGPASASSTPEATTLEDKVDSVIRPAVRAGRFVGVVVAAWDRGSRKIYGFGRSSATGPTPDAGTVFEIGSLTKTYTAAVLASAVRDGLMALQQPARDVPPGAVLPSWQGQGFTLLQLASHTSGLPRLPDDLVTSPGYVASDPYAHYDEAALASFLSRYVLPRAPGSRYEYSNLGFGLLGHLLERRLGVSYEEAVLSRVARPLGLADTRITLDGDGAARLATGHDSEGRPVPPWTFDVLAGAGALRSTAADQLTYAAALLGHGPAPVTADIAACIVPRFAPAGAAYTVGLAWVLQPLGGTGYTMIGHDGGTAGFSSFLGAVPERDVAVVVLSNSDQEVVSAGLQILEWLATR
jgi:CubicO group peptidase (beta-lactamase class C family)